MATTATWAASPTTSPRGRATFIARKGDFDECQIDKSGRWLLVKEQVDGRNGEDNRIIDLQSGAEQIFYDEEGAAGHSDLGYGYLVAEDNMYNVGGAVRVWQFGQDMKTAGQGTLVYAMSSWDGGGVGHVSHGNAKAGTPINQQMVCSSNAYRENLPRVNEIVCYRLDGSMNTLIVAPNMTDLNASGGGSDDYSKRPKGNLDPTGEYFVWTSNARHEPQRCLHRAHSPAQARRERRRTGPRPGAFAGSRARAGARADTGACSNTGDPAPAPQPVACAAADDGGRHAVDESHQRDRRGECAAEDRRLQRMPGRQRRVRRPDQRQRLAGVRGV